jgi:hypothetical protein
MPKSVQGRAKELIHEMYLSPTRKAALTAYDQFIASYQAKYPKATDCLRLTPGQENLARRLVSEGKAVRELAVAFKVHAATIYRLAYSATGMAN